MMYEVVIDYDWYDIECIVKLDETKVKIIGRHLDENLSCEGDCGGNHEHW